MNNGWADYRDRHLGPELKEFQNLQFGHTGRKVHVLGDGRTAYAISQYSLKAISDGIRGLIARLSFVQAPRSKYHAF